MAKGRFCFLLICMLVNWAVPSSGYIYRIDVLRKVHKNQKQYIFALGDWHDGLEVEPTSKQHRQEVEKLLQSFQQGKKDVAFIVEDTTGNCQIGPHNCANGLLGGLEKCCKKQGLLVENVEYRFKRMRACRPWLYTFIGQSVGHGERPYDTKIGNMITIGDIMDEYQEVVRTIEAAQHYIGGPLVQHNLAMINTHVAAMDLLNRKKQSLNDYLSQVLASGKHKTVMAALVELLTFDSTLVDLAIVKSVTAHLATQYLFIIAGGTHTERVVSMLHHYFGYEVVDRVEGKERDIYDLKKCAGSCIIDGNHCKQPEPVSLDLVTRYLGVKK